MSCSSTYSEINIFSVDFYRPQTKFAKFFFFFFYTCLLVILFTGSGGGSASGGGYASEGDLHPRMGVCIWGGGFASGGGVGQTTPLIGYQEIRSTSGHLTGMHSCLFKF